jgi:hypothetical protein
MNSFFGLEVGLLIEIGDGSGDDDENSVEFSFEYLL